MKATQSLKFVQFLYPKRRSNNTLHPAYMLTRKEGNLFCCFYISTRLQGPTLKLLNYIKQIQHPYKAARGIIEKKMKNNRFVQDDNSTVRVDQWNTPFAMIISTGSTSLLRGSFDESDINFQTGNSEKIVSYQIRTWRNR